MWYPGRVTVPAEDEPVSLDEAKAHSRWQDTNYNDAELVVLASSARAHVEKYCNTRFATQTMEMKCDCFADMARLPEAPVQSVASITYLDTDGAEQTVQASVYELRADGIEASIILKNGQSWPSIQAGSRIMLTAVVGYGIAPDDVKHAMLLFIAGGDLHRESGKADGWTAFDSLLCNHRRGA